MRVLTVCLPAPGHVNPLRPLLTAFVQQGDEVLVASGDQARDAVAATGARYASAAAGIPAWFATLAGRIRGAPGDGLPPERIEAYFIPRLFAEIAADDMAEPVIDAGRAFAPDLVLFETSAFAGPLAAAVLGKPAVHLQNGLLPSPEVRALAADAATPLWRSFGLDLDRDRSLFGDVLLRTSPPSLQPWPSLPVDVLPVRPTPLPEPAGALTTGRPLVHATLGTMTNQVDTSVLRCVIDALADDPVDLIVTVGPDGEPAALGNVPPHVRIDRYVPHAELLPRCAAVVSHGGAGTMYACLAHALPQVIVPQAADQFTNAAALEQAQVAAVLRPGEIGPDSVRQAVRRVLGDPAYRRRAAAVAGEIAAMPSAATVARTLHTRFAPSQN
jgi:UDP:flavonoid glycosyltransferase YjiC (YdhE family)